MLMGMSKKECIAYAKGIGAYSISYFENSKGIPQMIVVLFAKGGRVTAWFDHHTRRISEERIFR